MQRPNHPKRSAHETFCGNIELILEKYKECLSYPILEPLSSADNMKITEFQLLSVYTEKSNTTFNWVDGTGHILYSNSRGLCLNRDFFGSNELRHKKNNFKLHKHFQLFRTLKLTFQVRCTLKLPVRLFDDVS